MYSSTTDLTEQVRHRRYIELLAEEIHQSVDEVAPFFDDVMAHLKETANVTQFVPIFAWRRVRAILVQR